MEMEVGRWKKAGKESEGLKKKAEELIYSITEVGIAHRKVIEAKQLTLAARTAGERYVLISFFRLTT